MACIFFDIDGTILDSSNIIPDSTMEAVALLRKKGHYSFICTGRSKAFIRDERFFNMGFQGIVSGCGTMVEYEDKLLLREIIPKAKAEETLRTIRFYNFKPILEGYEYLYMDEEDFKGNPFADKLKNEIGKYILPLSSNWGNWEMCKLSCDTEGCNVTEAFEILKKDYNLLIHNENVLELVPRGYDKATGMKLICNYLNIPMSESVAFGDSINDLGMLKAAGRSLVMGNGSDNVKSLADYVTSDILDDGIWNGCRHLGLI